MLARFIAFLVWGLLAATVAYWALQLGSRAQSIPAHATPVSVAAKAQGDLTRLFGAAPVASPTGAAVASSNNRFKLLGTFASRSEPDRLGWATITVDGGPPRTYTVGSTLAGTDVVLRSVTHRKAEVGPEGKQGAATTLELPALPVAATGSLPPGALPIGAQSGPFNSGRVVPTAPVPPPAQSPNVNPAAPVQVLRNEIENMTPPSAGQVPSPVPGAAPAPAAPPPPVSNP